MFKSFLKLSIIAFMIFSAIGISYGWKFIIQGQIQETFDDNINSTVESPLNPIQYLSNPVTAFVAPREKKMWDFITEPKVGLGIRHEGKTDTLDLIGHIFLQIYSKNYLLFNYYEDATLNYTKAFSELVSFQITNVFQHYPEPDRFEVLFGTTQGRMHYLTNTVNINSLFEVSTHYFINIGYTNQYSKYFYTHTTESYVYDFYNANFINQDLKFSLMHHAVMRHEIHWDSANNTYIFYEYEWMKQNPGGITQVHRPGLGYRHDFTKQLYIEGRAGLDFTFPYHNIRGNINAYSVQLLISPPELYYMTPYFNVILSNDVDIKTNAKLTFTYQNQVMNNTDGTITNWQILGDVTRYVLPRLSLTSSIFYGQGVFYARKTLNRLFGLSISTAYDITEHISAYVSYNFTLNYNHVNGYRIAHNLVWNNGGYVRENSGYIRNRVSVGVKAEF